MSGRDGDPGRGDQPLNKHVLLGRFQCPAWWILFPDSDAHRLQPNNGRTGQLEGTPKDPVYHFETQGEAGRHVTPPLTAEPEVFFSP